MDKTNPTIDVTNGEGNVLSVDVHWTADVWEYVRIFRLILEWLEFSSMTIDKAIPRGEEGDGHEEV